MTWTTEDECRIPFTQFLRPDGRQKPLMIERPEEIGRKAHDIIDMGLTFECEVLTTGDVHLTVSSPPEEIDLCSEVVPNGPEVLGAVDRLVTKAHRLLTTGDEPKGRPTGRRVNEVLRSIGDRTAAGLLDRYDNEEPADD